MNILDFGAKRGAFCGDAIQRAIDAAAARGGGRVSVPAGEYETAGLVLRSNVELHLEAGAVLRFVDDFDAYPVVNIRWEGYEQPCHRPLVYAKNEVNVALTGLGMLEGQGKKWWTAFRAKTLSAARPCAVCFEDCTRVRMSDFVVRNSPSWTIHPVRCEDVTIDKLTIVNPFDSPNTDGIDPESCEYIRIIGMNIHVGDDCIAMKASKVFLGMKLKRSCEHTVIRNCLLDKGHGGIVIGSEMSGGVKDMVVTQCLMDHTDRGLRVKTRRGRGNTAVIDGLVFRNVEMRGVKAPFVINMFYFCDPDGHGPYVQCREPMPVDEYTPKLGSLTMENIVATDAQFAGCYFDGLPEQPIERVTMRDVSITFDPNAKEGQAAMADNRPLVKKLAIYAENVKEIDLHNVKIEGYEGERLHFANVGHFEED